MSQNYEQVRFVVHTKLEGPCHSQGILTDYHLLEVLNTKKMWLCVCAHVCVRACAPVCVCMCLHTFIFIGCNKLVGILFKYNGSRIIFTGFTNDMGMMSWRNMMRFVLPIWISAYMESSCSVRAHINKHTKHTITEYV